MSHATLMRAALFVSLCIGTSYAQSQNDLSEAPAGPTLLQPQAKGWTTDDLPEAPQPQNTADTTGVSPFQKLPTRPSLSRAGLIDRRFILWTAISFGATIADVESTRHAIDACGLREANPLLGANPSRARMYATALPIAAAQSFLGWYIRKRRPESRLWMLMPAANTALHATAFANNFARCH